MTEPLIARSDSSVGDEIALTPFIPARGEPFPRAPFDDISVRSEDSKPGPQRPGLIGRTCVVDLPDAAALGEVCPEQTTVRARALAAAGLLAAMGNSDRALLWLHQAITIDDASGWPYKVLLIRGEARIDEVQGVATEYAQSAARYFDAEQGAAWVEQVGKLGSSMMRIAVKPEWVGILDFEQRFPSAIARKMMPTSRSAGGHLHSDPCWLDP